MKLVVTIPALNEEKTIYQVVSGVPRNIPGISEIEIIVVNDGSADNTAREALRAGAIVVSLPGRGGLGHVFRTGIERAMRRGADFIVNIDGDAQFDPADIPKLVQPLLQEDADFVTCSRFADPRYRPKMPLTKYVGNKVVTRLINWICGGTQFTDVSCGFRAFNREAAYRLTLFGRYTYTQECFIDLFSKGLRMAEVPLRVRGVREFGKSRVASSLFKYATNSFPIILRAMRDIQPMKFFGGISAIFGGIGVLLAGFLTFWYLYNTQWVNGIKIHKTTPFTSLIPIAGVFITLGFVLFVLALLADMMGRHRRITEELLYLARRRMYPRRGSVRAAVALLPEDRDIKPPAVELDRPGLSLHDSWSFPIMREVPTGPEIVEEPATVGGSDGNGHGRATAGTATLKEH
jgi:glycosyltransferase involved in cell wall biosynthesis